MLSQEQSDGFFFLPGLSLVEVDLDGRHQPFKQLIGSVQWSVGSSFDRSWGNSLYKRPALVEELDFFGLLIFELCP